MRKSFLGLALLAAVALSACSPQKVTSGNVGVKVNLLGGDKGVDSEVVGVGRYWLTVNEDLFIFPTFTQNYVWTADAAESSPNDESITFQTIEGMVVSADIGISYRIDPDMVSNVFQKYRKGVDEITDIYLRNAVRDALVREVSTRPIQSVYGKGKGDIMDQVQATVAADVAPIGIVIEKIYWVGNLRLPPAVTQSLNQKIQATQKAAQRNNEIQTTIAEAKKVREEAKGRADAILSVAKAQAEANKLLSASLTPQLVQYRALDVWDGVLPRMTGSQAIPFVDVTSTADK